MNSRPWIWTEIGEKIVDRPMIAFKEKPATMTIAIATAEVMKNRSSAFARRGAACVASVAINPSRNPSGRHKPPQRRWECPIEAPNATGFARNLRSARGRKVRIGTGLGGGRHNVIQRSVESPLRL